MVTVKIDGQTQLLGKMIGKGGEGDVYALHHTPGHAVKIYKENLRGSREAKVRAMVEGQLAASTDLVAFPAKVVTDGQGAFAGFVMRLVNGHRPIHELYSPKSRKLLFPKADYRFLVRVALNVVRAVGKVHQTGCVIGDFNHSGVLVSQDATVALIDADSFQFSRHGRAYNCLVGVPDFTPPELHGTNLGTVTRTRAHDHFGLAVAIFHLLAMGKHPYAGRFAGGDLTMSEAIAQHRFAFSILRKAETRTIPPPGAVSLGDFPLPLARALEAAFGVDPSARPDAGQWVILLKELETSLRQCSTVRTHYFPSAAGQCLWCRLAGQSGVDMFPDLIGATPPPQVGGPFDVEQIWRKVRDMKLPAPDELLPSWTGDSGNGSPEVSKVRRTAANRRITGVAAILAAAIGFGVAPTIAVVWVCLGIFGFVRFFSDKTNHKPFHSACHDADQRLRNAQLAYLKRIGFVELQTVRDDIERWVADYRALDQRLAQEIARLKVTREARQRTTFLDRFLIRRAKISGIGPAKTATLASYGIETAGDVIADAVLGVPGFGEAMTAKLLAWRQAHEAKFRYNPTPDASDLQAENAVRSAHAKTRAELQAKIRSAASALQSAPDRLKAHGQGVDQPLLHALKARALAVRDLEVLGLPVPPISPLSIPVITPAAAPAATAHAHRTGKPGCPRCGAPMQQRVAGRGYRKGRSFWGCSRYPACTGIRN